MPGQKTKTGFYGWKNVGLLFLIVFCAFGLAFYSFSVIFPVMIQDMGWPRGRAGLAHTLCLLLVGFMAPVLALSITRFGVKRTMILGLAVTIAASLLLGTIASRLWIWIALWGLVMPVGFAFGGLITAQTAVTFWFSRRRALAMGIVTSGAAAAGFLAQPVLTWLMTRTQSWQAAWLVVAGSSLAALVLSFFVVGAPGEIGQNPDGLTAEETDRAAKGLGQPNRTYRSPINWPLKEVVRKPAVWLLMLLATCHGFAIILISAHGVLHLTDSGFTPMQAASVLSLIILASGLAALPVGWLADLVEPRWLSAGCLAGMLVTFLVLWQAPSMALLMAAGLIFGFSFGAVLIFVPTMIGNYFGPETFPRVNALLVPIVSVFISIVPAAAGFIADKTGSYDLIFGLVSLMLAVGTISALLLAPPKPTFRP